MKIKSLTGFALGLMLCQLTFAKMTVSNDILGRVESTLDRCAQVDQGSAEKYATRKKELVKDATREEVEAARESNAYKAAYKDMSEQLNQMPKDDLMQACTASLKGDK
jgi:hypothetical protein